ncbi:MAG: hypothetical protein PHP23_03205 [Desulfobacterales bacterium]|nr:hypothetical protein [Desulfobacterales bacterium]MDD4072566.1 hypothetical protein [Desulfobacterales bacterium]MDD4393172.1 hypothetical protein [Desulfobacterales bacterium]
MVSVVYFNSIPINAPKRKIYRRLGYREGVTLVGEQRGREIDGYIDDASQLIDLKGAALRIPVTKRIASEMTLADGTVFQSEQLVRVLKNCDEIVVMCVTGGRRIIEAIGRDTETENLSRAVVLDAAASEIVDEALEWIIEYWNRQLRRENRGLPKKRFSAGYGDFLLENQKIIYEMLHLDRIGILITGSCVLIPEKSVTAVAGIEQKS